MLVLGIDTSTRAGSVAVVEGERLLGAVDVAGALDHSRRLLPAVDLLLAGLGLGPGDLGGIAVTRGPGSFTGVRVGLATARGLARSAGVPSVGISTLEALAASIDPPPSGTWVCPWVDAGRGEIYAAAYDPSDRRDLERVGPSVARPAAWLNRLPPVPAVFVGDGAVAYRDVLEGRMGPASVGGPGPWFLGRAVARIGENLLRGSGGGVASPLEPLYLRPSDAESPPRPGP